MNKINSYSGIINSNIERISFDIEQGSIIDQTGNDYPSTTAIRTNWINVNPGYILRINSEDTLIKCVFKANDDSVVAYYGFGVRKTIEVPSNAVKVRFAIITNPEVTTTPLSFFENHQFEVYYLNSPNDSIFSTKYDYDNRYIRNDLSNGLISLPPFRNGCFATNGIEYYSTDCFYFVDYLNISKGTKIFVHLNDGFQYKLLFSDDNGATIYKHIDWNENKTFICEANYVKVAVRIKNSGNLNVYNYSIAGFALYIDKPVDTSYIRNCLKLTKNNITPTFINATIWGDGSIHESTERLIFNMNIPVDKFIGYKIVNTEQVSYAVTFVYYDRNNNFIKTVLYRPAEGEFDIPDEVRYINLVIYHVGDGTILPSEMSTALEYLYTYNAEDLDDVEPIKTYAFKKHAHKYAGEKISIGHDYSHEQFLEGIPTMDEETYRGYIQGGFYHDGKFYQLYHGSYCRVYDTLTKELLYNFYISGSSNTRIHANCATIGKIHNNGDLSVYVGSFSHPECYVFTGLNNSFQQTQLITFDIDNCIESNIAVDRLNKKLYLIYSTVVTSAKSQPEYMYVKTFNLPPLDTETVSLSESDVLDSFTVPFKGMQDLFVNGNRLYLLSGYASLKKEITVYNTQNFDVVSDIDMSFYDAEPEAITDFGNEMLISYLNG